MTGSAESSPLGDDERMDIASTALQNLVSPVILFFLLGTTSASQSSSATETFFPVFAAADAVESIKATMSELENRYPQMIGGTWFLHDRERGIVPARG